MAMFQAPRTSVINRLLTMLPREEYDRLMPNLEVISLPLGQVLYRPNKPIQHVYFPISSVVSLVTFMEDATAVEVVTVGNEGMVGLPVFLGVDQIPAQAFSQVSGDALRMQAKVFKHEVTPGSPLHNLLQRYAQALFNRISQLTACNRRHSIEQRCCRCLLMTHDRVGANEFFLTQEFLAQMLGVRRAGVSEVAASFQKAGLIRYSRGNMTILDRQGLEAITCECYSKIKQEFDRLLG